MEHEIIIIGVIAIIVLIQLFIWIRTCSLIKEYIHVFDGIHFETAKAYIPVTEISTIEVEQLSGIMYQSRSEDGDDEVEITYICIASSTNGTPKLLIRIINAINAYLLRNQGAVGDFNLIKDIVERYCKTKREEIETQLPMPLYLGLMGTMLGIIIGIGYIAIVSGFSAFVEHPSDSIETLMGGVAIAMVASLFGILLTTVGSWTAKNAFSQLEDNKNDFYSWIQAELLPVLGGTENSLMRLQENLLKFNRSFSTNTTKLDKALQRVETSYESQIELMQTIQQLDIREMATANVAVLRELQSCTPQLERFVLYLQSVNDYISQVNMLNNNINSQLTRTQMIEHLGTFFEQEVKDIEQRKMAISQAVGSVDDKLQQTLQALQENADRSMQSMNETLIRKQDIFNKALDEQQEMFRRKLQESGNILDSFKKIEEMTLAVNAQGEKLDAELEKLNALQIEIEKMATNQNKKMDDLISAMENMSVEVRIPETLHSVPRISKPIKWLLVVFVVLGCIMLLIQLAVFMMSILR